MYAPFVSSPVSALVGWRVGGGERREEEREGKREVGKGERRRGKERGRWEREGGRERDKQDCLHHVRSAWSTSGLG